MNSSMLFSLKLIHMNTPRKEKLGKHKRSMFVTRFKPIINSCYITGFSCFPHKWIPIALFSQLWNKIEKRWMPMVIWTDTPMINSTDMLDVIIPIFYSVNSAFLNIILNILVPKPNWTIMSKEMEAVKGDSLFVQEVG